MEISMRRLSFGAAALFLASCARDEPQPAASAAGETIVNGAPITAAAAPAESGLSLKRGVATVSQDHATFRPCGEQAELAVLDQSEVLLARTFAPTAGSAPAKLYVEVYGERASGEGAPEMNAYGGVFVLEEVLYAAAEDAAQGCAAPPADYIVAARGVEPFWAAEVREAQIIWRQPEAPEEIILSAPQTEDVEGAVRYRASGAGHEVEVLIDAQPCRDAMSGEFFAYSAQALLDKREFKGCARIGGK